MSLAIRNLQPADEPFWRELWSGYLAFYEAELPAHVTNATWTRTVSDDPAFQTIVAEHDGEVIGFANLVLHDFTWSDKPAGLLHDLFVDPGSRSRSADPAMIQYLIDKVKREGWDRAYRMTKADNAAALHLYDTFTTTDGFIRYRVGLQS